MKKVCAMSLAAALALAGGMTALAEDAGLVASKDKAQKQFFVKDREGTAMPWADIEGHGGKGGMGFGLMNREELTEEQKAAVDAAQSAYDTAEDAVLDEMTAAGALTQELVDSYRAQRAARRKLAAKDYSSWTLDQMSALRLAVRQGNANETILAGLVSQGALTQEEADWFRLAYGESVNLWGKMETGKATQGMMGKLKEAANAYRQALIDAGVKMPEMRQGGPKIKLDRDDMPKNPKDGKNGKDGKDGKEGKKDK